MGASNDLESSRTLQVPWLSTRTRFPPWRARAGATSKVDAASRHTTSQLTVAEARAIGATRLPSQKHEADKTGTECRAKSG